MRTARGSCVAQSNCGCKTGRLVPRPSWLRPWVPGLTVHIEAEHLTADRQRAVIDAMTTILSS